MLTDNQNEIIDGLTREVLIRALSCACEQHQPARTADEMDQHISQMKTELRILRDYREKLENIFTRILL